MKEETKKNIKQDVTTGTSSAIGATIGMVAGSALSNEANAAEMQREPEIPVEQTTQTHEAPTKQEAPAPKNESKPEPQPEPQPEPAPTPQPEPAPQPAPQEHEVEVLGYETIANQDGSLSDVAVVSVDGQAMLVADVDRNGVADLIICDANANGEIEEGECVDISSEGVPMDPFMNAAIGNTEVAQEQDYVNDADVNDYMA